MANRGSRSFQYPRALQVKFSASRQWHNSVQSIRNSILRWDIRNYREHATEWNWILTTLTRDLEILYSYEPYPLCRSYLSKYLSGTISDDRKEWKKIYFETGKQHSNMPDAAFNAWQPWWMSKEGRAKCEHMKELRAMQKTKQTHSLNMSSSSGGSPHTEQYSSPVLHTHIRAPAPQVHSYCAH
jgi:hypothetical protein